MGSIGRTAEEQSEQRTCDLRLALFRYGGVHTWYDATAGLKRRFVLSGCIDDPYRRPSGDIDESGEGDSAFHNKPVRVDISSPPDPKWLGNLGAAGDDGNVFGWIWVTAGVEPERFELDGEAVEAEPVEIKMEMDPDAFEAIRRQAAEADNHCRIMWATVTLAGKSLPKLESRIRLKNLDVSAPREDTVIGFEIFDTRYTDDLRGRVLQVKRDQDEGYGAHISILLTEARYEIHAERALVHSISCEGRVINGRGKPYDGVEVTVEFAEPEPNSFDELPERAFFGEFGYWAKRPDKEHSSTHFAFYLRYLPEDARNLLIPLLSQEAGTQVVLTVNLTNEKAELLAATDELRGNVRHYSFKVRRRLVDYGAALKRLEEARERLEQRTFEGDARFSPGKGVSEEHFQRIRRSLLDGGRVPDMELQWLSFEQIDALADELGR
ncbi:MAG: hypothetical protein ACE5HV_18595 [Acidobacteriota bacterium]